MTDQYAAFFRGATGRDPYAWQARIAAEGLPEALEVPTGCGKTQGIIGAWLYRRREHPDPAVRAATPRHLVFTLPMRTLAFQTVEVARAMVQAAGYADDPSVTAMVGGEPPDDAWRRHPERDAIVVCTLDLGLSGALNRAYGVNRFAWPVSFGILNTDSHWVFDEVQLMGPAAATSRQLQAFRDQIGTYLPTTSTWMSATLDPAVLETVDAPTLAAPVTVDITQEPPSLLTRLDAPRRFQRWLDEDVDKPKRARAQATAAVAAHRAGTRTLVIVNTVKAAKALFAEVRSQAAADIEVVLLHSRFRPEDRQRAVKRAVGKPTAAGTIVVSTQVVEAGVDITSAALFTESAPWSSIVQRAGRCNRGGEIPADAPSDQIPVVRWDPPASPAPYFEEAVAAAEALLAALDGRQLSTRELAAIEPPAIEGDVPLVIRRPDLVRLFDTAPDIEGNDIDIAPFIRAVDDLDAYVAWRVLDDQLQPVDHAKPGRDELCAVPVDELRQWLKKRRRAVALDHLATGTDTDTGTGTDRGRRRHQWVRADASAVRPGQILIIDPAEGGYRTETGWDATSTSAVDPVASGADDSLAPLDEAIGDDPATFGQGRWVSLSEHLGDVRRELEALIEDLDGGGLGEPEARALVAAGRLHDLGKVHEVFQDTLARSAGTEGAPVDEAPWAKSARPGGARHSRPHFRHELASALALLAIGPQILDADLDLNLVTYLVAAHHGRVRMSIRSYPGEDAVDGQRLALGVLQGEELPEVEVDGVTVPASTLDLGYMDLGHEGGSWVDLATELRDRETLGVFRLGYLEALVRVADWRVSASYDRGSDDGND